MSNIGQRSYDNERFNEHAASTILGTSKGSLKALAEALKIAIRDMLQQFDEVDLSSNPYRATGDDLDEHGTTFGLERNSGESDSAYRTRLIAHIQTLFEAPTVEAISDAFVSVMSYTPEAILEGGDLTADWHDEPDGHDWSTAGGGEFTWAGGLQMETLYINAKNNPNAGEITALQTALDNDTFDTAFRAVKLAQTRIIIRYYVTATSSYTYMGQIYGRTD